MGFLQPGHWLLERTADGNFITTEGNATTKDNLGNLPPEGGPREPILTHSSALGGLSSVRPTTTETHEGVALRSAGALHSCADARTPP